MGISGNLSKLIVSQIKAIAARDEGLKFAKEAPTSVAFHKSSRLAK